MLIAMYTQAVKPLATSSKEEFSPAGGGAHSTPVTKVERKG
jgi:hypothetical protein